MPSDVILITCCVDLQQTYKSNSVLNSRIIRFGAIEQALQKPVLKLELTLNFIPKGAFTVAAGEAGVSAKSRVVLSYSIE